ncbi:MAG: amidohydrolase family protein [Acidobacteria bacterium]|nr:amidohydrolase family protein [Acidobacteriota bacterium]
MRSIYSLLALAVFLFGCAEPPTYDVVLTGGRVIDPASGLDAVRNVGIQGRTITAVSEDELRGVAQFDVSGLVVAPGFIDLHRHGDSPANYRAQIYDGVTSSLELEIGVVDVAAWYGERDGVTPVNFGAAASHPYSRDVVMFGRSTGLAANETSDKPASPEQIAATVERIETGLEEGAVGVGFGIVYTPGINAEELQAAFGAAARAGAPAYVHIRADPGDFSNLDEVFAAAEATGASLHIVHVNSSGGDRALQYLERIQAARDRGLDVTTECYPYNRGSTAIDSHQYDDWESYSDEKFAAFTWVDTGESLNRESFAKYRALGGTIISPATYSLETVKALVAHPMTIIASDGMWLTNGRAHPRTFGTYARVLGHYVREEQALTLNEALTKMTIQPARRLEHRAPMMARKGRLEVGADADIVVFDPATVIDVATFEDPARYSTGFRHVFVNGVPTLQDGAFVEAAAGGIGIKAESE